MTRRPIAASALALALVSCSGAGSGLPTHDFASAGEALLVGRLGGSAECLWRGDTEQHATALVFPHGTTSEQLSDGGVPVDDARGRWSATTGDDVALDGSNDADWQSCLDNGESVFLVGFVTVCADPACSEY